MSRSRWWASAAVSPATPVATFGKLLAAAVALRVSHVAQLGGSHHDQGWHCGCLLLLLCISVSCCFTAFLTEVACQPFSQQVFEHISLKL